ncbi:MAG: Uma2 family endonuclease [Fimbriiglobus sp.]|nr:Uma2 family endonuclease [Fimbriiglobus sp.]
MTTATPTVLMTGEEFALLDGHELMSLVDGVPVVEETDRCVLHGQVCAKVGSVLFDFVKPNRLGTVCSNNTSIRLKRNPDTVFGPDLCYFSADRLTREERSAPVCDVIPDLVVEVAMPTNPWRLMERKARGYIVAGVTAVMVVVPEDETATVYRLNEFHQTFHNGDELTLPDVLPGFAVPVKRFFE